MGIGVFTMLWVVLILGSLLRLAHFVGRFLPCRREVGVVAALIALIYGYLVIDGWAQWNVWEFLGYQHFPQFDMYLRSEPGFGLRT